MNLGTSSSISDSDLELSTSFSSLEDTSDHSDDKVFDQASDTSSTESHLSTSASGR